MRGGLKCTDTLDFQLLLIVLDLIATHLHRELKSGRTKPLLLGCTDTKGNAAGDFVVKLSGAMDTRDRGPACEVIAVYLANFFGISHAEPAAVTIHPDLAAWLSNRRSELKGVLKSSPGPNFGTRLLTDVTIWPTGQEIPPAMLGAASAIFTFDALISNDDRRMTNPNVLTRGSEMFVIDHEAAFSFLYLIGGRKPKLDINQRKSLREHVFFYQLRKKAIDLSPFIARLADLTDKDLEKIFSGIPNEWRHDDIQIIDTHLQFYRENCAAFERQILEVLA